MVASTLITDYFAQGTHTARPASPNVATGATAIYYETDTTNTFAWTGAAWVQINATAVGPAVVQQGVRSVLAAPGLVTGITLASAPVNGNLLYAVIQASGLFTALTANTGWKIFGNGKALVDISGPGNCMFDPNPGSFNAYTYLFQKTAGAGESATQTPVNEAALGSIAMWEVSGGFPGLPLSVGNNNVSGAALPITFKEGFAGQITLGAYLTNDSAPPTVTSGMQHQADTNVAGAAVTAFWNASAGPGSVTVSTTNSSTKYKCAILLPII